MNYSPQNQDQNLILVKRIIILHQYHHYTFRFKLKILELTDIHIFHYIEKEYGIDRHLIRKWQKDKLKLETTPFKKQVL